MAEEFLSGAEHSLTARVANLMQRFVNGQEEQIEAFAETQQGRLNHLENQLPDDGRVFGTKAEADAWRYDGEAEEAALDHVAQAEQSDIFEPAQLSLLDRLDALEKRVTTLEDNELQRHIDRAEGMSY